MGKYVDYKVAGYWLYYTASCFTEGTVHVHANKPTTQRKGSAKLWVYENGNSKVEQQGEISNSDIVIIQEWIKDNIDIIHEAWFVKNRTSVAKYKQI